MTRLTCFRREELCGMKAIKIKYVGFWDDLEPEKEFLTLLLRKHYQVTFSDDPDYVICSGFGFYDYLDYPQVRILYSGENYIPDFNFVDYALSVYPIDFLDRHCTIPGILLSTYDRVATMENKKRNFSASILDEKPYFANLIAGHEAEKNMRGNLMRLLETYRRVESAGSFENNMPDGQKVNRSDGSKLALQRKCKFTICSESVAHEGFVTEKIYEAFLADTIPIYYGSSTVSQIFNRNAYIDVRDYDNLDAVLARVVELDSDDEKYLQMLNEPIFSQDNYIADCLDNLESFLCHIIDQPMDKAYRRCKAYMPARYENELQVCKRRAYGFLVTRFYTAKEEFFGFLSKFKNIKKRS